MFKFRLKRVAHLEPVASIRHAGGSIHHASPVWMAMRALAPSASSSTQMAVSLQSTGLRDRRSSRGLGHADSSSGSNKDGVHRRNVGMAMTAAIKVVHSGTPGMASNRGSHRCLLGGSSSGPGVAPARQLAHHRNSSSHNRGRWGCLVNSSGSSSSSGPGVAPARQLAHHRNSSSHKEGVCRRNAGMATIAAIKVVHSGTQGTAVWQPAPQSVPAASPVGLEPNAPREPAGSTTASPEAPLPSRQPANPIGPGARGATSAQSATAISNILM